MIGLIIGIIFIGFSLFITWMIVKERKVIKSMDNWYLVEGEVIENKQEFEFDGDTSSLMQTISYTYFVNDNKFESYIKFQYDNTFNTNRSLAYYKKYEKIEILYNPLNVEVSTLKEFDHNSIYEGFGFAFLFAAVGIIILLTNLFPSL